MLFLTQVRVELGIADYLLLGVDKDDGLGDGKGHIEFAKGVELPLLPLRIHIELLDTLQGQPITLHQNADLHKTRALHQQMALMQWHPMGQIEIS